MKTLSIAGVSSAKAVFASCARDLHIENVGLLKFAGNYQASNASKHAVGIR